MQQLGIILVALLTMFLCVSCVSSGTETTSNCDTICVKLVTDSCHFSLDSANFVIDERKIEYFKP